MPSFFFDLIGNLVARAATLSPTRAKFLCLFDPAFSFEKQDVLSIHRSVGGLSPSLLWVELITQSSHLIFRELLDRSFSPPLKPSSAMSPSNLRYRRSGPWTKIGVAIVSYLSCIPMEMCALAALVDVSKKLPAAANNINSNSEKFFGSFPGAAKSVLSSLRFLFAERRGAIRTCLTLATVQIAIETALIVLLARGVEKVSRELLGIPRYQMPFNERRQVQRAGNDVRAIERERDKEMMSASFRGALVAAMCNVPGRFLSSPTVLALALVSKEAFVDQQQYKDLGAWQAVKQIWRNENLFKTTMISIYIFIASKMIAAVVKIVLRKMTGAVNSNKNRKAKID